MKTKLILFSALAFVMLSFNGCTPDEVVTAQGQFKPLIIRATASIPIEQLSPTEINGGASYGADFLSMEYQGALISIDGGISNQVGDSIVEYVGTAVSNTPLNIEIIRKSYTSYEFDQGPVLSSPECSDVHLEIEFDGVVVYSEQRTLGGYNGSFCGDGNTWNIAFTLP